MATPALSETITHGIRVGATAFYLPEESSPNENRFLFGYRIVILNEGRITATLRTRHWIIIDGNGTVEDVKGDGVVGQQPRLAPGEGFKYTSYCPLTTEWGTMEGTYEFRTDEGERLDVRIGRFYLARKRRELLT
jgi:ApaG protein